MSRPAIDEKMDNYITQLIENFETYSKKEKYLGKFSFFEVFQYKTKILHDAMISIDAFARKSCFGGFQCKFLQYDSYRMILKIAFVVVFAERILIFLGLVT